MRIHIAPVHMAQDQHSSPQRLCLVVMWKDRINTILTLWLLNGALGGITCHCQFYKRIAQMQHQLYLYQYSARFFIHLSQVLFKGSYQELLSLGMIFFDTLPGGRECVRKYNLSRLPKLYTAWGLLIRKNDCSSYLTRLISAPHSLILEQLGPQCDISEFSLPITACKKYSLVSNVHVVGLAGKKGQVRQQVNVSGYRPIG